MSVLTKITTILWLSLCLALTACGGGGGGSSNDTSPPPSDNADNDSGGSSGDGDSGGNDDSGNDDSSDDEPNDGGNEGNDGNDGNDDHNHEDIETGDENEERPPHAGEVREAAPPEYEVSASPQQLKISWDTYANDDHYHLWEYVNGAASRTPIAILSDTNTRTIDVVTHRHPWANVSYILSACVEYNKCEETGLIPVTEELMLNTIGYVKPFGETEPQGFGTSVAVSEDGLTLAVGTGDNETAGSVFLYTRTDGTWMEAGSVSGSAEASDRFGASLALSSDGQTLAVGAPGESSASGAVYLFNRADNEWTQAGRLAAANAGEGDEFGLSVALSADGAHVAIGAPGEASGVPGIDGAGDDDTASGAGATYVFSLADENWSQTAYIKASNAEAEDGFGQALALSADGTRLAVAATGEDSAAVGIGGDQAANDAADSGAVYLFANSGDWQQQAYLKASDSAANLGFGQSLDLSDDGSRLVVGSAGERSDDEETLIGSNAAYLFTADAASWTETAKFVPNSPASAGEFGASVAISSDGSYVVVGAPATDSDGVGIDDTAVGGAPAAGAVFSFAETEAGWEQEAFIKASNTGANDRFGSSVALGASGDRLAVGATGEDGGATGVGGDQANDEAEDRGAVYLY